MIDKFKVAIGNKSFLTLDSNDIKSLGRAFNQLISVAQKENIRLHPRDVGVDLAAISLGYNRLNDTEANLSSEISIVDQRITIGDQPTLISYTEKLLESIAKGLEGSHEALTWFLDGLIGSDGETKSLRDEVSSSMEEVFGRYREIKQNADHIQLLRSRDADRDYERDLFCQILALAPRLKNKLSFIDEHTAEFTMIAADQFRQGSDNEFSLSFDADNNFIFTRHLRLGSKIEATINKDSVPGRILSDIYKEAQGA